MITARLMRVLVPAALLSPASGYAMSKGSAPAAQAAPLQMLPLPPPAPTVLGILPREAIRRVVFFHLNEIRHCYQVELLARPALSGRLVLSFRITDRGQVAGLLIKKSTLNLPSLHHCVTSAVARWEFPATASPGETQVTYPFVLRPRPPREPGAGVTLSDEELERLGVLQPIDDELPAADILF